MASNAVLWGRATLLSTGDYRCLCNVQLGQRQAYKHCLDCTVARNAVPLLGDTWLVPTELGWLCKECNKFFTETRRGLGYRHVESCPDVKIAIASAAAGPAGTGPEQQPPPAAAQQRNPPPVAQPNPPPPHPAPPSPAVHHNRVLPLSPAGAAQLIRTPQQQQQQEAALPAAAAVTPQQLELHPSPPVRVTRARARALELAEQLHRLAEEVVEVPPEGLPVRPDDGDDEDEPSLADWAPPVPQHVGEQPFTRELLDFFEALAAGAAAEDEEELEQRRLDREYGETRSGRYCVCGCGQEYTPQGSYRWFQAHIYAGAVIYSLLFQSEHGSMEIKWTLASKLLRFLRVHGRHYQEARVPSDKMERYKAQVVRAQQTGGRMPRKPKATMRPFRLPERMRDLINVMVNKPGEMKQNEDRKFKKLTAAKKQAQQQAGAARATEWARDVEPHLRAVAGVLQAAEGFDLRASPASARSGLQTLYANSEDEAKEIAALAASATFRRIKDGASYLVQSTMATAGELPAAGCLRFYDLLPRTDAAGAATGEPQEQQQQQGDEREAAVVAEGGAMAGGAGQARPGTGGEGAVGEGRGGGAVNNAGQDEEEWGEDEEEDEEEGEWEEEGDEDEEEEEEDEDEVVPATPVEVVPETLLEVDPLPFLVGVGGRGSARGGRGGRQGGRQGGRGRGRGSSSARGRGEGAQARPGGNGGRGRGRGTTGVHQPKRARRGG